MVLSRVISSRLFPFITCRSSIHSSIWNLEVVFRRRCVVSLFYVKKICIAVRELVKQWCLVPDRRFLSTEQLEAISALVFQCQCFCSSLQLIAAFVKVRPDDPPRSSWMLRKAETYQANSMVRFAYYRGVLWACEAQSHTPPRARQALIARANQSW